MNLLKATPSAIKKAASVIKSGGTAAFPTETVYGLGANALNAKAAASIFGIKRRPSFDPLIVHICSIQQAKKLAIVSKKAEMLMRQFWPGPLTLVLPKKKIVPDIVTAGLSTVALRMPAHPVALDLIKAAGVPIAAPSANRFGRLSPTTAAHVRSQLGNGPDIILDGGKTRIGVESTVLALDRHGNISILRHGGLPMEDIKAKIGGRLDHTTRTKRGHKPDAPGQLKAHYAPVAALILLKGRKPELQNGLEYGYLAFSKRTSLPVKCQAVLSHKGDMTEAAANLFAHLHRLDAAGVDIILAEPVPLLKLGRAIMDRLRRAAAAKNA